MNNKFLALSAVAAIAVSSVSPISTNAQEQNIDVENQQQESSEINLSTLISQYKISNTSLKDLVYIVTYEKDGKSHEVIYNGNTGEVFIDNILQKDVTYEYEQSQLLGSSSQSPANTSTAQPSTSVFEDRSSTSGYKYMGTLKGKTDDAKNLASFAVGLGLLIPGLNFASGVAILLIGYAKDEYIPSHYYTYKLYEKGAMTSNWYQYSTVRIYKDSKRLKPAGDWWTSSPQQIYLPNS